MSWSRALFWSFSAFAFLVLVVGPLTLLLTGMWSEHQKRRFIVRESRAEQRLRNPHHSCKRNGTESVP